MNLGQVTKPDVAKQSSHSVLDTAKRFSDDPPALAEPGVISTIEGSPQSRMKLRHLQSCV